MAHYLTQETYDRLVKALSEIPPCRITGEPDLDAIMIKLGEIGDVWPDSIIEE